MARELPRGTVTFLFTDIEGSTRLLKRLGDGYADVLRQHQGLLRAAFEADKGEGQGSRTLRPSDTPLLEGIRARSSRAA